MRYWLLVIIFFFCSGVSAQHSASYDFLIKFWSDVTIEEQQQCLELLGSSCRTSCVSESFGYHLIHSSILSPEEAHDLLLEARRNPHVQDAFYNFPLELRGRQVASIETPNDPEVINQWYLQRIGAFDAWDITTGGVTAMGDTVAYAIYEVGFQKEHFDLSLSSFVVNKGEIQSNGVDDDGNGFVDDYIGYNVSKGNDDHFNSRKSDNDHGNGVVGIIGATTNNESAVAGLIWNPKMLLVTGRDANIASWIQGMDYIMTQRKLYNETAGARGAFVVAYNMSFGIGRNLMDPGIPEFCALFDSLGSVGIISVGATTNTQDYNVDTSTFRGENGDIPSNCPSPHLIITTNSDFVNEIVGGIGVRSVDLAAPAEDIATINQDGIQRQEGTSFAAPQIVSAVGMVYSVLAPEVLDLAVKDPPLLNDIVVDLILDNTRPVETFSGKVKTGGILDLSRIINAAVDVTSLSTTESSNFDVDILHNGDHMQISVLDDRVSTIDIQVIDLLGRNVLSLSNSGPMAKVDLTGIESGLYILRLTDGSIPLATGKFFKR